VNRDIEVVRRMESHNNLSLADGIEQLCLGDELSQVVATRLGAIPKVTSQSADGPPPPLATPGTPQTGQRRQTKRRNRKDRRRPTLDGEDSPETKPVVSRVSKLRAAAEGTKGVQRSSSDVGFGDVSVSEASSEITEQIFKSQSSINIATGVRNLPDSFFNDELPDDTPVKKEGKGDKRRRKGKKRPNKQASTEEDDKKGSSDKENNVDDLKDKLFDDDIGEDIVTNVGDEHAVYNWRNVTRNGDIKKCVLVDGVREGGRPKAGDVVLVKSQGKLKDGTMIDDYPTLVFRVGEYEVIEGLDLVVQSMHKNELAIVSIKPILAYGEQGRKPDIPADARITYLFGLLHFEKQKEMEEMTWAQRRKMGQSRMRIANWWYSRKEYPIAVKCYKKALQFYNNIPTNQECATPEEYKELLTLMEERLRVMRQVANIFKRIANLIQSGQIET